LKDDSLGLKLRDIEGNSDGTKTIKKKLKLELKIRLKSDSQNRGGEKWFVFCFNVR
jgi:hypothetical protein